jgi:UDP-N-acetylglucosamine--dolichyl-phosphate N-acetylglucosaminephosphotransferase
MQLLEWLALPIIFVCTFLVTFFTTWFLSKYFLKIGIYGHDVHKADKPKVAEMGGVGLVIVIIIACISCIFIFPDFWEHFTVAAIVILMVGLIGLWDDLKALGPITKPFLLLLPSIPLILWQVTVNPTFDSNKLMLFRPNPLLPLIGPIRITLLYWLLVPFAITILANATNMLDVMNGSTPITTMMVTGTAIISTVVLYFKDVLTIPGLVLAVILFGCLFAFFWFNKYPAKIFCGDTGSLSIGAMIALIAIFGRIEIIIIVAMMPHIMNSFQIIHSLKGLRERRQIKERPTIVLKDERVMANDHSDAPLTLTRWLVAKYPMKENEIVLAMGLLSLVSSIFALITMALIGVVI